MKKSISVFWCLFSLVACSKKNSLGNTQTPETSKPDTVYSWHTRGDQTFLLTKQFDLSTTAALAPTASVIDIDTTTSFQSIDGFGYTLTGGSAMLLQQMSTASRAALLQELFGTGPQSIGVSYLRVSIGASDLSPVVFSYNDMPAGQTDPTLSNFSLSRDTVDVVPILKEILLINPSIKIMGSPWSAPAWMKTNNSSIGGSLLPQFYSTYAQYFVKYIQAMKARGITIDAITVQNEPQHGGNNPSMLMNATEQTNFIKSHLGPAFQANSINTKIIIWDHNCDNPGYPISVLNDPAAKQYINGSAFHLYAGDISALTQVYNAHPDKSLYFTEQWTGKNGSFDGDLRWHMKNVIIGSMLNRSRNALEWNLANDPAFGPHTPGGCTECKGALTISGSTFTRNVSYYIIAHASKFIPAGSVRIGSSITAGLPNVAFKTPAGKKVLIVLNDGNAVANYHVRIGSKSVPGMLPVGAVATYVW